MKNLIRKVLNEEINNKASEKLVKISDEFGLNYAIKAVGDFENFIKIVYDSDIKEFFKDNNIRPYHISPEPNLFINDFVVQMLDLSDAPFSRGYEKNLGDFNWVSGGIKYKFTAYLRRYSFGENNIEWKVVGQSGDSGFGYSFISKKDTLGKRARMQIFQQIIDKYNLDSYK